MGEVVALDDKYNEAKNLKNTSPYVRPFLALWVIEVFF